LFFADEVQNFIDQPNPHERVEQLRMFVHAFRTLDAVPLGMLWGLTARIEERLFDEAGDMVQRVQDYGAFLNLQTAYTREFPKRLWEHLCRTYAPEAINIVDEAALEALGQICERGDLSNGPRTVIAAFRCVASRWRDRQQRYTVWDLISDYEHHHIVFEGQGQKITTTLQTLLNEPTVQANPEFQKAVRFLCAFPEGVSRKVAENYGVWKAIDQLANAWGFLGTHIYQPQHDQFALNALSRTVGAVDRLTELLRRFRNRWWHYVSEREKKAAAKVAFLKFVLPELFPKRSAGEQSKWTGFPKPGEEIEFASQRVASFALEGSFEGTQNRFPQRRIAIAVAIGEDEDRLLRWRPSEGDIDLSVRFFLLDREDDWAGEIVTTKGEANLDFRLNLNRHYDDYPSDLHVFRDIMSPHHITVMLLLNLAIFLEAEMGRTEVPESDRLLMETNLLRPAIRHIVALALNEQINLVGVSAKGVGQSLVEQVFAQKCEELYPDYAPLLTGRQSENDIQRYQLTLLQGGLTRSEKQGLRPKLVSRDELAKLFAIGASQRDAFIERLERMKLLQAKESRTMKGLIEVTFTEHPLEREMRKWLKDFGNDVTVRVSGIKKTIKQIDRKEIGRRARNWGAYKEEIEAALQLAKLRGTLDYDERRVWEAVAEVNPDEIRNDAESLQKLLAPLSSLFAEDVRRYSEQLDKIIAKTLGDDEAQWDEARIELEQVRAGLKEFARQAARQVEQSAKQSVNNLHDLRVRLPIRDFERRIEMAIAVAQHLDDVRRQLLKDAQRLSDELQNRAEELEGLARQAERLQNLGELDKMLTTLAEVAAKLKNTEGQIRGTKEHAAKLEENFGRLARWREIAERASDLRQRIPDRYGDLRAKLDEWVQKVIDHFADHKLEALKDYEQFEYELNSINRELAQRAGEERKAFEQLAKSYERMLRGITESQPSTHFDSEDPEGSYERLFQEVLQRLSSGFGKLGDMIQQDQNRILFLRVIRQVDTSELEKETKEVEAEWHRLGREITYEVVKAVRDGDKRLERICGEVGKLVSRRSELLRKLNQVDKPLPVDDEEQALLDLLKSVGQRHSGAIDFARIWDAAVSSGSIAPDKLLSLVERLYRKGWLDIHISQRK
jgi:methyl-accepting chemotaxis protein